MSHRSAARIALVAAFVIALALVPQVSPRAVGAASPAATRAEPELSVSSC